MDRGEKILYRMTMSFHKINIKLIMILVVENLLW